MVYVVEAADVGVAVVDGARPFIRAVDTLADAPPARARIRAGAFVAIVAGHVVGRSRGKAVEEVEVAQVEGAYVSVLAHLVGIAAGHRFVAAVEEDVDASDPFLTTVRGARVFVVA